MSISFAADKTIRSMRWSEFIDWVNTYKALIQYDDTNNSHYDIWFYDGPEIYTCTIWKTNVPDTILYTYSQEQNDLDKADFEDNYKANSNKSIEPKTADGRPIYNLNTFEDGAFLYVPGAADDPVLGRDEGTRFRLQRTDVGTETLTWQFNDWIKLVGGSARYFGGVFGDEVNFGVDAPATEVEEVTPGEGTMVLVDTGVGFNAIIPYAGGTHNIVEGSEVPVPVSVAETGYWNWNQPDTGPGVITPKANAAYNLYDAEVPLSRHVANMQIIDSGVLEIGLSGVEPLIVLPQWKFKVELKNGTGGHTVQICWELRCSRMKTTVFF